MERYLLGKTGGISCKLVHKSRECGFYFFVIAMRRNNLTAPRLDPADCLFASRLAPLGSCHVGCKLVSIVSVAAT